MVSPMYPPGHGLTALLARCGEGKSCLMVDLGLRLALDMGWQRWPVAEGYIVVYACGEDDQGAEEMVRAWCVKHDIPVPSARFVFVEDVPDINSDSKVEAWAEHQGDVIGADGKAVLFVDT